MSEVQILSPRPIPRPQTGQFANAVLDLLAEPRRARSSIRKLAKSPHRQSQLRRRAAGIHPFSRVPGCRRGPIAEWTILRFPIWRFSSRILEPDQVAHSRGPASLGGAPVPGARARSPAFGGTADRVRTPVYSIARFCPLLETIVSPSGGKSSHSAFPGPPRASSPCNPRNGFMLSSRPRPC